MVDATIKPDLQIKADAAITRDWLTDKPYTEVCVSISENGYQWSSIRVPAERWPEVIDAVTKLLAVERPVVSAPKEAV
jgi:hypothetical protein